MKIRNKIKTTLVAAFVLGFTALAGEANAQQTTPPQQQQQAKTDFSDAELKQFADANTRLMAVQQEGEKAMLAILKEENVEVEKFNELAQAHQQQRLSEVNATPEELAAFNNAAQRIMEMQPTMQKDVEAAIVKDGMTLDKYEQIMMAYQQSPAVQEKVHKLMQQ